MEGHVAQQPLSLKGLFPHCRFFGGEDVLASRVVIDPSECEPGVVLAITADCDDPLSEACEALARGASGVLTEQILPVPLTQCVVSDVERAAARLADQLMGNPADDLLMVGVLGADGKTTTALLAAAVLRGQGQRTAYETDLGACDGIIQSVSPERLCGGLGTAEFLADARDSGCAAVVLELDEPRLRSAAIRGLAFDVLILVGGLNESSDDPLVRSLDIALEQLREGGVALVNADSPAAMAAADRAGVPTLTFGMRNDANVAGKIFEQHPGQTTLMVTTGDVTAVMETALTGPAMASCQLAALALGMLIQTPLHQAIAATVKVRTVPGRMQRIASFGGPSVVIDRCGSAQRLRSTLRSLRRERNGGRLWVIADVDATADELDCAASGRVAEKYADRIVLTSGNAGKHGFLAASHNWLDGFRSVGQPRLIADRAEAIDWVIQQAADNDTILVAGGWSQEGPTYERAALAAEVEMLEHAVSARSTSSRAGEASAHPVILPHPALKA